MTDKLQKSLDDLRIALDSLLTAQERSSRFEAALAIALQEYVPDLAAKVADLLTLLEDDDPADLSMLIGLLRDGTERPPNRPS